MYFSIQTATSPSNGDTNQYLANQYVAITVNDNAVSWRLRVYTNNFNDAPNPAVWGYNYGGLVNAQLALIATMGWYCTASNTIPNTGNPQFPATTGWKNFLDKMDADNPSTGSVNESFSSMDDGGYTNIAYGTGSYTRVIRPNIAGPQSVSLNKFNDTFYLYLEAGTPPNTDMNATYNATVVMDLIHQ
jgi:hypothetical protein